MLDPNPQTFLHSLLDFLRNEQSFAKPNAQSDLILECLFGTVYSILARKINFYWTSSKISVSSFCYYENVLYDFVSFSIILCYYMKYLAFEFKTFPKQNLTRKLS